MSDNLVKHLIAICGTLIVLMAYFAGYISSQNGWWWTVFATAVIYIAIIKLIDV
jgi:hypothetical protein